MTKRKFPSKHGCAEERNMFLSFIRQASPEADPRSITLFGQFMLARNLLAQAAERDLACVGFTLAEFRLLTNLLHQEQCNLDDGLLPSELSDLQGISPNTMSALINRLEANGMIRRELHPTDRRKFVIRLTPNGRQRLESQMEAHLKHLSDLFQVLNQNERHTLNDLLSRLNGSLKEQTEKCKGCAHSSRSR